MLLRHRFVLAIAILPLAFLAGCGGSSNKPTPPPSGGFSISNLKGTYVFSTAGSDSGMINGISNFLAITGTFDADGSGGITGGALDMRDPAFTGAVTNNPITGGSYTVTADGRGKATLITATPFSQPSIIVDFVLTSSEHGFIIEFDGNGSGSGTLDLQTSTSQPAAGTYVFGLTGISGTSVTTGFGTPAATAGAITVDASGNATGTFDYNDNGTPSQLPVDAGSSLTAGTPGTATVVTSSGTLTFDVYVIDSTHMKLIETDTFPILTGDLFPQTSATFPSGQLVYSMAGLDFAANGAPLALGGYMTSDGTSTISAGFEDFNDGGTADSTPLAITGSFNSTNGRFQVTLSNFENGQGGVVNTFTFVAYPSDGGIEMVEIDGLGVTSGVAFPQSSTALSTSAGYGMNLSAADLVNAVEVDHIVEFTSTSSSLSGLIDVNAQGSTTFDQKFSGTYTPDSPATGRGVISANAFGGAYYTIDGANALFLETDSTQVGMGSMATQNASAKSNLAASHMAMLRTLRGASAKRRAKEGSR